MPINSIINQNLNTIIRTVTGELNSADVKGAFDESLSLPDFKENMHVIWDLSAATIGNISANQLMEIVEHIRNNIGERGADYKIVLVAPIDLIFGMSRMFESYGYDLPTSIQVVREIDEAYRCIEKLIDSK